MYHLDMLVQVGLASERGATCVAQERSLPKMLRADVFDEQVLVAKGGLALRALEWTEPFVYGASMFCPGGGSRTCSRAVVHVWGRQDKQA